MVAECHSVPILSNEDAQELPVIDHGDRLRYEAPK